MQGAACAPCGSEGAAPIPDTAEGSNAQHWDRWPFSSVALWGLLVLLWDLQ